MPRYIGPEARWESFRRWLVLRLTALRADDFLVLTAPGIGYVQFINEGGNLLGECSGPAAPSDAPPSPLFLERMLDAGWGPREEDAGSPNFRVLWFPAYVPAPTPERPWTPDLDDAVDAADLAVRTLREVLGVGDAREVGVDGGRSMTVTALDAELGSLFPGEDD